MDHRNGKDGQPKVLSQDSRMRSFEDTPLDFPVDFPIKVIGRDTGAFRELVLDVLDFHFKSVEREGVAVRPSRSGTYTSITATVTAESKHQLHAAYAALTALDEVLWAL